MSRFNCTLHGLMGDEVLKITLSWLPHEKDMLHLTDYGTVRVLRSCVSLNNPKYVTDMGDVHVDLDCMFLSKEKLF